MFFAALFQALLPFMIAVVAFCFLGCLLAIFLGWRRRSRPLVLLGVVPLVLTLVAVGVQENRSRPKPLSVQAKALMSLPADAQLVDVQTGDWGDGSVEFRFPPTRSVRERFESVWAANLTPGARAIKNVIWVNDARHGRESYVPSDENDVADLWKADGKISVRPGFAKQYDRTASYSDGDRLELSYDGETHLYKFAVYVEV